MKDIFKLYIQDLKKIKKSYSAIIVIIALCVLPSLYAWFNIKASWDPYSQQATNGIKIGVVNQDKGTIFQDANINIGEQIIEQLKNNHQMGWQFVDEKTANKQLNFGDFYANIIIPQNFSESITSFASNDIKKPEIIYNVNEKINAIAPKITDKGATAIQENVNNEIRKTISDVVLSFGKNMGIEIKGQSIKIKDIYENLVAIKNKFNVINQTFDLAENGTVNLEQLIIDIKKDIPLIQNTLENSKNLTNQINIFLNNFNNILKNISPIIKQDIKIISEISLNICNDTKTLIKVLKDGLIKAPEILDNLILKIDNTKEMISSLIKLLKPLNNINPNKPFKDIIEKLESNLLLLNNIKNEFINIKNAINNNTKPDLSKLENIVNISNNVYNTTIDIYNNFDIEITNPMNEIVNQGITISNDIYEILNATQNKIPEIQTILNEFEIVLTNGEKGIKNIKLYIPKVEKTINNLMLSLDNFDIKKFDEILNLLTNNINLRGDFITNPIDIIQNQIFPMMNYGTGMTPFYTVLSLWVGILLLVSIISLKYNKKYKSYQVYFGKLLLFLSITIIQALIVSLGDLYILKIYCANPLMFILGNIFTSITFTFIVYSLVSVFGNVGKVLSIILLVLQVAGSGGTFPIQLTPKFFQIINPFLPFTYAISFGRETIGGIVNEVLLRDTLFLLICIIFSLLLGIFLKKPINKLLKGFTENFEKSQIGE